MTLTNPTLLEAINADTAQLGFRNVDGSYKFGVIIADLMNTKSSRFPQPAEPYNGAALGLKFDLSEISDPTKLPAFGKDLLFKLMDQQLDITSNSANSQTLLNDLRAVLAGCPNSLAALNEAASATVDGSYAESEWGQGTTIDWHEVQVLLGEQVSV